MKNLILLISTICLLSSCVGDRTYVHFHEDGLSTRIFKKSTLLISSLPQNDTITIKNNGNNTFYASVVFIDEKEREKWHDYFSPFKPTDYNYKKVQLNPGDSIKCNILYDINKGIDECGHEIPIYKDNYVGYFDSDGEFRKSKFYKL